MLRTLCLGIAALLPLVTDAAGARTQDALAGARAELARLAWLTGTWSGSTGGVWHQEVWLAARGGTMLGLHHEVHEGRDSTLGFEYLRIEAREDGVFYIASPMGRAATPFELAEIEEQSVTFVNEEHDFPQRIHYERKADELFARVEGEGASPLSWHWKLVR